MTNENVLFLDTETTGILNFRAGPEASGQPRVVQLGAILADGRGARLAHLDLIIRPDGWTVPGDAARVHGITTERAAACGVPIALALDVLDSLALLARRVVAHNADFDRGVLAVERHRRGTPDPLGGAEWFCTMHACTSVCQIPGGRRGFKWPTLGEAHHHFFGKGFDNAHSALADVEACMRIYFELYKPAAVAGEAAGVGR